MTTTDGTGAVDLGVCLYCEEPCDDGQAAETLVLDEGGWRPAWLHRECVALGIVGHRFGVCGCTGFDRSRASALELKRRLEAEAASDG